MGQWERATLRLAEIERGGKCAIAGALAALEAEDGILHQADLLDEALTARRAHIIGITGPPGAGKSTAINLLAQALRDRAQSVAVVAVDPSSKRSGGALLGDRHRFALDPADQGLMVRSLAARAQYGGLAEAAIGAVVLLAALFDKVIVETVGVGQSETDIAGLADSVVVAVQPASGDSLQFMKAGIMEIPDILAITKADLGALAERTARDMAVAARARSRQTDWQTIVLKLCGTRNLAESGVNELADAAARHLAFLSEHGLLASRRAAQLGIWQRQLVGAWFGRHGLAAFDRDSSPGAGFADLAAWYRQRLRTHPIDAGTPRRLRG